jgi:hypothetical protein
MSTPANPAWRQFEQLVSRIEQVLKPRNATVTSPGRVRDQVTGEMREVDASIRFEVDSVPILITVECRDREAIQDVTWIEQLVTKRQDIGATQTIAVTSSHFTQPALRKAKRHGIEVRTVQNLTDEEIAAWTDVITVEVQALRWSLVSLVLFADTENSTDGIEVVTPGKVFDLDSPMFIQKPQALPLSPRELVTRVLRSPDTPGGSAEGRSIADGITVGDPQKRLTLTLSGCALAYAAHESNNRMEVARIQLILDVQKVREKVAFSRAFQYRSPEGLLMQAAEGTYSLGGGHTLLFQWEPRQEPPSGSSQ